MDPKKAGSNLKTPLEQELLLAEEHVTKLLDKPDPEMAQAIASITLAKDDVEMHEAEEAPTGIYLSSHCTGVEPFERRTIWIHQGARSRKTGFQENYQSCFYQEVRRPKLTQHLWDQGPTLDLKIT